MSITYPITERRRLDKAEKQKWYRRAERTDLPRPDAHHVLVFRIGGNYVLDTDRMGGADDRVVQATHVSLVDMRRDAPVVVMLEIPSKDAASFEVIVTFTCSVTDPVAVVRGGVEAQQALWSHLKAHNRIFELGLDYPLAEINEVRRVVSAQVKAYLTIRPPSVPGMTVAVASVEMTSPELLAGFEDSQRKRDYELRLAERELEAERQLALARQDNVHILADEKQAHDHQFDGRTRNVVRAEALTQHEHEELLTRSAKNYRREDARLDADQEQLLAGNRADYARDQFAKNMEVIGSDPRRALLAAFADGRIDASALSEQLRQLDDQDRVAQIEQAQREREERLQLQSAEREERRIELDLERTREERQRAEQQRVNDLEREHAQRLRDQERDERLEKERHARIDRLSKDKVEREELRRSEEAEQLATQQERQRQFELLKTMTAHGHFNNSDMQGERLLATVMNLPQPEVEDADRPALAADHPQAQIDDEEHRDPELREEDV
jgi:hypothetical protein